MDTHSLTCDVLVGVFRYFVGKKALFDSEFKKGESKTSTHVLYCVCQTRVF